MPPSVSPAFPSRTTHAAIPTHRAQAALEQAEQDLAYIKTQLSKAAKVALAQRTESPERRRGHYVVRGGQVVEGVGKGPGERAISSWREGNVDPDQLARHKANLRRFKFMDRDVPPPRGPQWS